MTTSIKHLSNDMTASFKQLAEYQITTEQQLETRFNQVEARLDRVEARLDTVVGLLTQVLERLPKAS